VLIDVLDPQSAGCGLEPVYSNDVFAAVEHLVKCRLVLSEPRLKVEVLLDRGEVRKRRPFHLGGPNPLDDFCGDLPKTTGATSMAHAR